MADDGSKEDDEKKTLKAIAENVKRVEEMLRFLPFSGETVNEIRGKVALLRSVILEHRPPALALVGRRGAGKSSLVNALFGAKVAEVGHVRSQTGRGKWFPYQSERGVIEVLDTRGTQEGTKPDGADADKDAVASVVLELKRKAPDVIVFLVKATEADSAIDGDLDALERIYAEVEREHRFRPPLVAIATHCDVLEPKNARLHRAAELTADATDAKDAKDARAELDEKLARVAEVEHHLESKIKARDKLKGHLAWTRGISSYLSFRDDGSIRGDERWRIEELLTTLFRQLPDAGRGTFVRIARVRGLQEELASNLTRAAAMVATGFAWVPIPMLDIIPITSVQVSLVAAIAWLSGRELSKKTAAEFLAASGVNVGTGFVLREAYRQIVKAAPIMGGMASGAIAFSGTLAIGAAARAYFLRNATLEEAKKAAEEAEEEAKKEKLPVAEVAAATEAPPPPSKKPADWDIN